jgi:hypothetical protein
MYTFEIILHKFLLIKLNISSKNLPEDILAMHTFFESISGIVKISPMDPIPQQFILKFFAYPDSKRYIRGEFHGCAMDNTLPLGLYNGIRVLSGFTPEDVSSSESIRYEIPMNMIEGLELINSFHAPLLINWRWLSDELKQELYGVGREAL